MPELVLRHNFDRMLELFDRLYDNGIQMAWMAHFSTPREILDLVEAEGTVDEAFELAVGYADEARRALDALPGGDAREALEFAPDFVLNRRS